MCHHQAAESLVCLQSDNPNNGLVGKRVQGKAIVLFLGMFTTGRSSLGNCGIST